MRDIRILSLFKQHYLDEYKEPLKVEISCLGYYDGMNISKIDENEHGSLTVKKSQAPISEIWYNTGNLIKKLQGGYSNQNIGLFRCVSTKKEDAYTEEFWNQRRNMPFWAVGFIKLKDATQYGEIAKIIEGRHLYSSDAEEEAFCNVIVYCTFDNADMVVLIHGNSISSINHKFEEMEAMDQIIYLHSIIGVSEEFLSDCKDGKTEKWRGTFCHIHDRIRTLWLEAATNGAPGVVSAIVNKLSEEAGKRVPYSYMLGHGNISMLVQDVDVALLLKMLCPGGFLTHQNGFYGNGLYNIESSFLLKEKDVSQIQTVEFPKQNSKVTNWCITMIKKYRKLFSSLEEKDESLYSLYQALVQTLNTLDQYERFCMSQDIYALIYPSFKLFDQKLESVLSELRVNFSLYKAALIKDGVRKYLECVNSVIYHIIHTDQIYLMIPGYSGTSFSIPIKLDLFYLWFMDQVRDILNDSDKRFRYIMTPIMESKPLTDVIRLKEDDENYLIRIRVSQRQLYFPRNLMIILSHELGHYVGRSARCRKKRLDCITKTLACVLTERIFPENYDGDALTERQEQIFQKLKHYILPELQIRILSAFNKGIQRERVDRIYHAQDIRLLLGKISVVILSGQNLGADIKELIYTIPEDVMQFVESGKEEEYLHEMRYIADVQRYLDLRCQILLPSTDIPAIIDDLVLVYKEIFSDMVALTILQCGKDDYEEAFRVSEGTGDAGVNSGAMNVFRKYIAGVVFFHEDDVSKDKSKKTCEKDTNKGKEQFIRRHLFEYTWTEDWAKKYAKECCKQLKRQIEKYPEKIADLRKAFQLFSSNIATCKEIYDTMNRWIREYKDYILLEKD
ncbi:MAG: hypothetical protein ACI4S2_15410 [Lachnospiraceae bacterium]